MSGSTIAHKCESDVIVVVATGVDGGWAGKLCFQTAKEEMGASYGNF